MVIYIYKYKLHIDRNTHRQAHQAFPHTCMCSYVGMCVRACMRACACAVCMRLLPEAMAAQLEAKVAQMYTNARDPVRGRR